MPEDLVTISTSVSTIPDTSDYYGNVAIIGGDNGGSASAGQAVGVSTATQAETEFGADTDLTNAVSEVLDQGVGVCYGVKASISSNTETVDSVAALSYMPSMLGTSDPSATSQTVYATYDDTPGDWTVDADEMVINTYTKDAKTGSSDDITYDYVENWDDVQAAVEAIPDLGVVGIAGAHKANAVNDSDPVSDYGMDTSDVFDYSDIVSVVNFLGTARAVMPLPIYGYDDSDGSVDTTYAKAHTTDVSEYENKGVVPIAHMFDVSTDEMNGILAGTIVRYPSYDKLLWKQIRSISSEPQTFWTTTQISTLEDAQINAVLEKDDMYVFSNGYSGSTDSTYQWIDIVRTQYLIEDYIKDSLNQLIGNANVPFNQKGINMVKDAIETGCREAVSVGAISGSYINDDGQRVNGYKVSMPKYTNISDSDKENRILDDVEVTAKLPGHIHEINMTMSLMI